jgi:hypothetical protein
MILRAIVSDDIALNDRQILAADFNADDEVNTGDATAILSYIVR